LGKTQQMKPQTYCVKIRETTITHEGMRLQGWQRGVGRTKDRQTPITICCD